jgi:hypothetical protein
MEERTIKKMQAAAKIAFGVGKGISAVMLATGHGFLGAAAKSTHHMAQARTMAARNLKSAQKTIDEGVRDWERT